MSGRVAPAWLLEFRAGRFAAFALQSTLAILEKPAHAFVPGAPRHCLGLMRWESHRLPLLDLGLLGEGDVPEAGHAHAAHALVLAWRLKDLGERAALGALAAPNGVTMIEVRDEQQCEAPADSGVLRLIAASWFEHEGRPVAVIDTARLFSGWLEDTHGAVSEETSL